MNLKDKIVALIDEAERNGELRVQREDFGRTRIYAVTCGLGSCVGNTTLFRKPGLTDEQWLEAIQADFNSVLDVVRKDFCDFTD